MTWSKNPHSQHINCLVKGPNSLFISCSEDTKIGISNGQLIDYHNTSLRALHYPIGHTATSPWPAAGCIVPRPPVERSAGCAPYGRGGLPGNWPRPNSGCGAGAFRRMVRLKPTIRALFIFPRSPRNGLRAHCAMRIFVACVMF